MGLAQKEPGPSQSDNKPDYGTSFIDRAHRILNMGYTRLNAPSFAKREEQEITGELTRTMQEAVDDASAPRWAKHFWVEEETPIHGPGRLGKHRRRIDIRIMQHGIAPRPRFRFEAKRLHDTGSRGEYLGKDGLERFLDGRYAKEDQIAGMLGYVQQGTVETQANALASALEADPDKHGVCESGGWTESAVVPDLATFRSIHHRACSLPPITLLHTLLLFC